MKDIKVVFAQELRKADKATHYKWCFNDPKNCYTPAQLDILYRVASQVRRNHK